MNNNAQIETVEEAGKRIYPIQIDDRLQDINEPRRKSLLCASVAIALRLLGTKAKLLIKSLNKEQMQNCKTSAQTAAKTAFKSSLLFRQATIAAILLLAAANLGVKIILSKLKTSIWIRENF
jgi:hypothetical protein